MNAEHDYIIRESARAKRARLTISPHQGLVVVVPVGFDHRRIPALVREKKGWIERCAAKIERESGTDEPEPAGQLPETIRLRSIGEEWTVSYELAPSKRATARERSGCRLHVSADIARRADCSTALVRWLKRKTYADLAPDVFELARQHGFRARDVSARLQRTRWGSCSRNGRISLNVKLLFLPPDLARYVLLHELCHSVHLNHSSDFWALVGKHEPGFKEKERELRAAWRYVPAWLDA